MSHCYIAAIKDDRPDTSRIGELKMGLLGKKETSIGLEGGATTALARYIQRISPRILPAPRWSCTLPSSTSKNSLVVSGQK